MSAATSAPAAPAWSNASGRQTWPNEAFWICVQTGVTPVAIGMPGDAKSMTTYAFGNAVDRSLYTLIGGLRDPADIGGYPYPAKIGVNGDSRDVMKIIPPEWAAACCDESRKWIIFLDELTTIPPAVQAAMLRILVERYVGDLKLPEDTWIMGACNPPDQAANGIEFSPPMANRLYHHQWERDTDAVLDGYANGLKFGAPQFPVLPDDWEQHIVGIGGLVSAFHRHLPGRLSQFPEDRMQQGGPWPSPRTWEYTIRCMAAARSVNAEKGISLQLARGLVGEAVALELFQWLENLDLPDPEELIQKALDALSSGNPMDYHHPDRPDKVMAMMAGINQAVISDNTPPRWEAGMHILYLASQQAMDVALACAKPLASAMPQGAKWSGEFLKELFPRIDRALRGTPSGRN